MIKLLNSGTLKELLKTDNLYSFDEDVLIENIKTLYPRANITIHTDYSNNNDLVALIIK